MKTCQKIGKSGKISVSQSKVNAAAEGSCWYAGQTHYQNQSASQKCRIGFLNAHAVLTCRENRCYQLSPHDGRLEQIEAMVGKK